MDWRQRNLMAEAMFLFEGEEIIVELRYDDFRAMLLNGEPITPFCAETIRAAYVAIGAGLAVEAICFCQVEVDENGVPQADWNVPVRELAQNSGEGPDLGTGPVRLGGRGQCSIPWHNLRLWMPAEASRDEICHRIQATVRRNSLGFRAVRPKTMAGLAAERMPTSAGLALDLSPRPESSRTGEVLRAAQRRNAPTERQAPATPHYRGGARRDAAPPRMEQQPARPQHAPAESQRPRQPAAPARNSPPQLEIAPRPANAPARPPAPTPQARREPAPRRDELPPTRAQEAPRRSASPPPPAAEPRRPALQEAPTPAQRAEQRFEARFGKRARLDDTQAQRARQTGAAIAQLRAAHARELAQIRSAHERTLAGLKTEIRRLRDEIDRLRAAAELAESDSAGPHHTS